MNEKKTSYILKNIDRDVWREFKGTVYLNGYDNVAKCLMDLIKKFVDKNGVRH